MRGKVKCKDTFGRTFPANYLSARKERMKVCSICGVNEDKTRIILRDKIYYCRKHYLQLYRYGGTKYTIYDKNEYVIKEDYAEITLKNKNGDISGIVLIDKEDIERCKKYKWHIKKSRNTDYAITTINESEKLFLHRYLLEYTGKQDIDHINHDGLDNRKDNLRIISHSYNLINQHNEDNGIFKVKSGRYRVTINKDGKSYYIGTYDTFDKAKEIRKAAELKFFG